jgi:hypothetical protein
MRRTPLRAKGKPYKPVALKRHHDRVAALGCLVCGAPAEVHHVTGYADRPGRLARDEWLVAPLCPTHHRAGFDLLGRHPQSVEGLGHQGFYREYGIDLLAEAMRLADETQRKAA